jgi:exosortase A
MAEAARGCNNFGHRQQRLPPEATAVVLQKASAQEHSGEVYRRAVRAGLQPKPMVAQEVFAKPGAHGDGEGGSVPTPAMARLFAGWATWIIGEILVNDRRSYRRAVRLAFEMLVNFLLSEKETMSSRSAASTMIAPPTVNVEVAVTVAWKRALAALAVGCIITLLGFRQTVLSMTKIWLESSTYSYGLLMIPIVGLLIWRLRDRLRNLYPSGSVAALAAFVCSTLLWLCGNIADVQIVQQIALVAMLDSLVWAVLGTSVATVLRFPLVFLFFAVPFGDSIVPMLQQLTANFVVAALRFSGIPAFQDGLALMTPNGSWQVAEACSGIRYLIASIVIGVLVAGVAYKSWKRRLVFLALSALLPIAANAIRAYGIVVLAYLTGNALATGVDHIIYGFIFFSLITTILIAVAIRWSEAQSNFPQVEAGEAASPANATFLVASLGCVTVVMVSALALSQFLWSRVPAAPDASDFATPAGWTTVSELDNEWAPDPTGLRQRTIETFSSGVAQVSTCFGWYPGGQRGVELINTGNLVGDSGVWAVLGGSSREIVIRGRPAVVAEHEIMHGRDHRLVWLWYSVGNQLTANPYRLRLIEAGNRLLGRPKTTALYAVSALYRSDPSEASKALDSFLK